jgi:ERCC4-type nuclease
MNRQWLILVDTREKKPLLFPEHLTVLSDTQPAHTQATVTVRLHTERKRLETGDYLLASHPTTTIVERKGSVREVQTNCLNRRDRARFVRCLERMRDAAVDPVLLLEGSPADLVKPLPANAYGQPGESPAGPALDALFSLLHEYGIRLLLLPNSTVANRRAMGEIVARDLIAGAIHHAPSPLPPCS